VLNYPGEAFFKETELSAFCQPDSEHGTILPLAGSRALYDGNGACGWPVGLWDHGRNEDCRAA